MSNDCCDVADPNCEIDNDDHDKSSNNEFNRPRMNSGSDDSLKWEEFFGGSLEIAPSLLSMYDTMVANNGLVIGKESKKSSRVSDSNHRKKRTSQKVHRVKVSSGYICNDKKRPSSISSTSSSGSSVSGFMMDTKKVPYLTSIESFDDDLSDDEDEEVRIRSKRETVKKSAQHHTTCNNISAPKPSAGRPKYWDPNLSYIDRVVMEIVETEKTYVSNLSQIITGYMQPIMASADRTISENHISDLFGNIEEIYEFNSNFLKGLEVCGLDPVKVAQCFVHHNEGFSIYTNYCTNYPRTVSVLTEVMRKEESAVIFKDRQASLEHTLPLGSYLLKPVQRILKYHLLLQNMVKHYEKGKEGANDIKIALSTMTGIASHINDMKRKHEHAVRVQEIQSLLYGWIGQDLTTYGELVAEGMFRVHGAKALRHVFLFDKMLLIAKKKEDATMSYKTHILCSNLMLIESVPGEPLSFHVIPFDNPKLMYTLQARTMEQKREWSLQLKRVILENYNAVIPSHARQLVMELGQSKEDGVINDKPSSKKQHSAPEYLEKRKQERRKSEAGLNKALRMKKRVKKNNSQSPKAPPTPERSQTEQEGKPSPHSRSFNRSMTETTNSTTDLSPEIDSSMEDNDLKCARRKSEPSYYSSRESLSLLQSTPSSKIESEDDCLSTSYLSEDNMGDYEMLSFSESKPNHGIMSSEDEDPAGDYITFDYAQKCLNRDGVCPSPSPAAYYRYYSKLANYDNLAHMWLDLGTVDVDQLDLESEVESCGEVGNKRPYIRRVQSFNTADSGDKDPAFQHTYSMRQSKKQAKRLSKDKYDSGVNLRPPSGIDLSNCPNTPMVWLKKYEQLSDNANRCGSLPRGFHSHQVPDSRPITIASDKPEKSDFLDDFERYIKNSGDEKKRRANKFPVSQEDCEDQQSLSGWTEASDTTSASTEALHPEYKIYRHSNSRTSLRSVLANVGSKLSLGIRSTIGSTSKLANSDQAQSCSNISLQSCDAANTPARRLSTYSNCNEDDTTSIHSKASNSARGSAKLVYHIAKAYGTMLKHRLKKAAEAASESPDKQKKHTKPIDKATIVKKDNPPKIYLHGSEAIGARMAKPSEVDYGSIPNRTVITPKSTPSRLTADVSSLRPDSVLSESSNLTSSSNESDKPKLAIKIRNPSIDSTKAENEDNTADESYYERSFEEIENMLENEIFRDSAIYSDQEDLDMLYIQEPGKPLENNIIRPEVPNKPKNLALKIPQVGELANVKRIKGNAILETLETLQKNTGFQKEDVTAREMPVQRMKSIVERRKELEEWQQTNRSPVMSPEIMVCEAKLSEVTIQSPDDAADEGENVKMKGWVKHLVGKFQSDCQQ